MTATIPGWSPEVERGFKEILFRFLEEIQCTRAALYLYGPEGLFLMATQYGFGRRDVIAIEHGPNDAMVKKLRELNGVPVAFNRKDDLGSLAEYLKSAGNTKLLLVPLIAGDEIIGFIAVWVRPDPYIDNLHVRPGLRSKGIGRRLMAAAAERLMAAGHATAYLWVVAGNDRAIAFYERLGGVRTGQEMQPLFGNDVLNYRIEWADLSEIARRAPTMRTHPGPKSPSGRGG